MGSIVRVLDVSLSKKVVIGEKDIDFTLNFIFSLLHIFWGRFIECAIDKVEVAPHSFPEDSLGDLSSYCINELYELFIFLCNEIEYDVVFRN